MSAAAAWSYTATATLWVLLGRDDWAGAVTYGPPQAVACSYGAKAERRTDSLGVEFTTRQIIYTERADIKLVGCVVQPGTRRDAILASLGRLR